MVAPVIVYDAKTMGALIGTEAGFPYILVVPLSIALAGIVAYGLRNRRNPDAYLSLAVVPVLIGVILLSAGWWGYGHAQDRVWAQKLDTGQFVKINGCVQNFTETVNPDHDIGTDEFTLSGRHFQITDNVWQLGYHTTLHHGSPIGPNTHLLIYADDTRMLRIEVLSTGC